MDNGTIETLTGHWANYTITHDTEHRGMFNHERAPEVTRGLVKIFIFQVPTPHHGTRFQDHTTCRIMVRKASHGYWEAFLHMDMFHDDMEDNRWFNVIDGQNFALFDADGGAISLTVATTRKAVMEAVEKVQGVIYTPPAAPVKFNMVE
tara:strand:+ start:6444 stop:6890 length:447 start_codon:yes stop_codon:yes gene_type:complete